MPRFSNLNNFPVILFNQRRGSEYLRPGEFRDGGWWSRFTSDGQLTPVADDWTPTRDFIPRPDRRKQNQLKAPLVVPTNRQTSAPLGPCSSSCEASCQIACESSEQTIVVHEHHEQVGPEFYCRYCDWSTKDEKHVSPHLKNYHPEKLGQKRPTPPPKQEGRAVEGEGPGTVEPASEAVDPGRAGKTGSVPTQDSPPSGPKKRAGVSPDSNEFWELKEDGLFHCQKCKPPVRYPWSTVNKGAMVRHAKSVHGYEKEKEPARVE